jgi:hypothetical protein
MPGKQSWADIVDSDDDCGMPASLRWADIASDDEYAAIERSQRNAHTATTHKPDPLAACASGESSANGTCQPMEVEVPNPAAQHNLGSDGVEMLDQVRASQVALAGVIPVWQAYPVLFVPHSPANCAASQGNKLPARPSGSSGEFSAHSTMPCLPLSQSVHSKDALASASGPGGTHKRMNFSPRRRRRTVPLGPMPGACEAVWQQRKCKRHAAVNLVKKEFAYQTFQRECPRSKRSVALATRTQTPDPTDRTVSKRQWEDRVRLWRLALKQWCQEQGHVFAKESLC